MTETEWLACEDPHQLLDYLRAGVSGRKMRLIGCACARRLWHILKPIDRTAVEMTEQYVDGNATELELSNSHRAAHELYLEDRTGDASHDNAAAVVNALADPQETAADAAFDKAAAAFAFEAENEQLDWEDAHRNETASQVALLHDIFGNPFRPITLDLAWLTSTVIALARGIYDERAFDRMPILADALQDAGCDNADVLNHCRDEKATHVRGCWVVDLLLGKE